MTYTPMLWSMVFPLGMYSLASLRFSLAADFPPLRAISRVMVWVALAAWAATFAGLVAASWQSFRDFSDRTQGRSRVELIDYSGGLSGSGARCRHQPAEVL